MKPLSFCVALLMAALSLAGCASDAGDGAAPSGAGPTDAGGEVHEGAATVDMIDVSFAPKVLGVHVGTTVTWRNLEDMGHTVTPDDKAQWGTSGSGDAPDQWLMKDDTWNWTFTAPGAYAYHCLPHATRSGQGYMGMAGTIIVE